ncbi:dihydrofolate reductase family protein [Micrococcoides hystricis]|uniref:Dihydrofolate reductase family protein n=1 Tax=Micrococcoides hystricis TaxID=1572761 RepID=A0ABV6P940_9MICC
MSTLTIKALDSFSDNQLLEHYTFPDRRWCRFNFVSSADGAATVRGHSSGLGSDADKRLLQVLRWNADVLLLGSGTIMAEEYVGSLISDAGVQWRRERGLSPHPAIAVLTTTASIAHEYPQFFDKSPVPPMVFTTTQAAEEDLAALEGKAVVHQGQTPQLSPHKVLSTIEKAGHRAIHSEGGPSIFARFVAADVVDQLCLTFSPMLVGSGPRRIADAGDHPFTHGPRNLRLDSILQADDMLFLSYRRRR